MRVPQRAKHPILTSILEDVTARRRDGPHRHLFAIAVSAVSNPNLKIQTLPVLSIPTKALELRLRNVRKIVNRVDMID